MADRYTYLTQIGISLAIALGFSRVLGTGPRAVAVCRVAFPVVVLSLMGATWRQASYWRDSETLWRHALASTTNNVVAHTNLGNVLLNRGRVEEAIAEFREAVRAKPNDAGVHNNLGLALSRGGRADDAMIQYETALWIDPDDFMGHVNLGAALANRKRFDEAIQHFRDASARRPDLAGPHLNLGMALYEQGKVADAVRSWAEAIRLEPDEVIALNRLAWVLATFPDASIRDGEHALELAKRAVQLVHHRDPAALDALAAAYAEVGQFAHAVTIGSQAVRLVLPESEGGYAAALQERLAHYRAGRPYRDRRKAAGATTDANVHRPQLPAREDDDDAKLKGEKRSAGTRLRRES